MCANARGDLPRGRLRLRPRVLARSSPPGRWSPRCSPRHSAHRPGRRVRPRPRRRGVPLRGPARAPAALHGRGLRLQLRRSTPTSRLTGLADEDSLRGHLPGDRRGPQPGRPGARVLLAAARPRRPCAAARDLAGLAHRQKVLPRARRHPRRARRDRRRGGRARPWAAARGVAPGRAARSRRLAPPRSWPSTRRSCPTSRSSGTTSSGSRDDPVVDGPADPVRACSRWLADGGRELVRLVERSTAEPRRAVTPVLPRRLAVHRRGSSIARPAAVAMSATLRAVRVLPRPARLRPRPHRTRGPAVAVPAGEPPDPRGRRGGHLVPRARRATTAASPSSWPSWPRRDATGSSCSPRYAFLKEVANRLPRAGPPRRGAAERPLGRVQARRAERAWPGSSEPTLLLAVLGGVFAEGVDYPGEMLVRGHRGVAGPAPGCARARAAQGLLRGALRARASSTRTWSPA